MQKLVISVLSSILILISVDSIARDKQPRRFEHDAVELSTSSKAITPKRKMSVEQRLQRLERLMNSQGLVDLLLQLESLQKEVQQLRGDVETQTHIANELKKRQRDLYIDIDRRMLQLERNGTAGTGSRTAPTGNAASGLTPGNGFTPGSGFTQGPAKTSGPTQSPPPKKSTVINNQPAVKQVDPVKERKAYQKAFDLLRELRYEQAIKAYREFIKNYPNGRYAHIAQYWLSEASYAQRHFKQAIKDYQDLVNNYPNSPKLAEAMLKISYSYYEIGKKKIALENAQKLLRLYPNTTAAGQAQNLIKKIKSSKR